jgi:hypothetical protein
MTAAFTLDGPIRCRTVEGDDRPACSLWKNADQDIPALNDARAEYGRLP